MPLPELTALKARLVTYVEGESGDDVDEAAEEALQLVRDLVLRGVNRQDGAAVTARLALVPDPTGRRACLEVGADLYYRRLARNGIVGINGGTVQPMRINRDPLTAAYPILAPYLGPAIA